MSMPSVSMNDGTENDVKKWNTQMALDDAFWAASLAGQGIREMHYIKNSNGEVILPDSLRILG